MPQHKRGYVRMCDQGLWCASKLQLLILFPLCPSQNWFLLKYTERWSASRSGCSDLIRSPEMVFFLRSFLGRGWGDPVYARSPVTACLRLSFPLLLLYSFFINIKRLGILLNLEELFILVFSHLIQQIFIYHANVSNIVNLSQNNSPASQCPGIQASWLDCTLPPPPHELGRIHLHSRWCMFLSVKYKDPQTRRSTLEFHGGSCLTHCTMALDK